jgi:hypothetical protein
MYDDEENRSAKKWLSLELVKNASPVAARIFSGGKILFFQPEELCRIVLEHLHNVLFRNSKTEKGANEDAVSLDAFHMEDLPKIPPDNASVGSNGPD